jgi:MFS family permease
LPILPFYWPFNSVGFVVTTNVSFTFTPSERKITSTIAMLYGLRMLGLFWILPIFVVYASALPGGDSPKWVGLALGIYGLTQAVLQLPYGMASDRFGRKPMLLIGLSLFFVGSLVAAMSTSVLGLLIGRAIQGAGAISSVLTATLADHTRSELRSKAMAVIGMTIGGSFALALMSSGWLAGYIGLQGIFWLMALLGGLALLLVLFRINNLEAESSPETSKPAMGEAQLIGTDGSTQSAWRACFQHGLWRLYVGVAVLHAAQTALFAYLPRALQQDLAMPINTHWHLYIPVVFISFGVMMPLLRKAEQKRQTQALFMWGIVALLLGLSMMVLRADFLSSQQAGWLLIAGFACFFMGFNVLEAMQPAWVSKLAPQAVRGRAMGVYNTLQSLGMFLGGALGGLNLLGRHTALWLVIAAGFVWLWVAKNSKHQ